MMMATISINPGPSRSTRRCYVECSKKRTRASGPCLAAYRERRTSRIDDGKSSLRGGTLMTGLQLRSGLSALSDFLAAEIANVERSNLTTHSNGVGDVSLLER